MPGVGELSKRRSCKPGSNSIYGGKGLDAYPSIRRRAFEKKSYVSELLKRKALKVVAQNKALAAFFSVWQIKLSCEMKSVFLFLPSPWKSGNKIMVVPFVWFRSRMKNGADEDDPLK